MNNSIYFIGMLFLLSQCKNAIKNDDAAVIQETGVELPGLVTPKDSVIVTNTASVATTTEDSLYGFWVGYFEKDIDKVRDENQNESEEKNINWGESGHWTRENKINISIDKIEDGKVKGHSVVAGNNRSFDGTVKEEAGVFYFEVKEPGDNKYDGIFTFKIANNKLQGAWKAYKKIDIPKRKYSLERAIFKYNPDIMLERSKRYADWEKYKEEQVEYEDEIYTERDLFSGATEKIYVTNASNKLLTKSDVENLEKGDLLIIRNAIYARHGYSFKNRPLRVFFDAQPWYIPVHADIKKDFTEIEKKNIELLLRYEKNAKEYYDHFGRG